MVVGRVGDERGRGALGSGGDELFGLAGHGEAVREERFAEGIEGGAEGEGELRYEGEGRDGDGGSEGRGLLHGVVIRLPV